VNRRLLAADLAVKAAAIGLALYPLVDPNSSHYTGKAMGLRAALWPLSTLVVPAWWLFARRPRPYPYVADILLVVPFLLDAAGNVFGLFAVRGFDAIPHFVGWFCLAAFIGLLVGPIVRIPWAILGLSVCGAATIEMVWEIGEFLLQQSGQSGLQLTYENTIQDLAMSLLGSVVGGIPVTLLARPGPETPRQPFGWTNA
jgi:hypothetical protein